MEFKSAESRKTSFVVLRGNIYLALIIQISGFKYLICIHCWSFTCSIKEAATMLLSWNNMYIGI